MSKQMMETVIFLWQKYVWSSRTFRPVGYDCGVINSQG
jgi:hypothetical protein